MKQSPAPERFSVSPHLLPVCRWLRRSLSRLAYIQPRAVRFSSSSCCARWSGSCGWRGASCGSSCRPSRRASCRCRCCGRAVPAAARLPPPSTPPVQPCLRSLSAGLRSWLWCCLSSAVWGESVCVWGVEFALSIFQRSSLSATGIVNVLQKTLHRYPRGIK